MNKLGSEYVGQSISAGTLRDQDLIETFMTFIENVRVEVNMFINAWNILKIERDGAKGDEQWSSWFLNEELFELLDEIAPEGCYFGSHVGDGCDFGFWVNDEIFEVSPELDEDEMEAYIGPPAKKHDATIIVYSTSNGLIQS